MLTVFLTVGSRYPVNRKKIRSFVKDVMVREGLSDTFVTISIVGDRKITELNEHFLHHEGVTDVLSFPQYDKGSGVDYESTLDPTPVPNDTGPFVAPPGIQRNLGDIAVSFPEAVRQSMKKGKMVDDHLCFLIEHGMMHLLGKHHE